MRKRLFCILLAALLLLLPACAGTGADTPYEAEHEHVYGFWYDVKPLTCVSEGEQIRYCKICLAEERQTLPISADVAARNHHIKDGSCTECGYTSPVSE